MDKSRRWKKVKEKVSEKGEKMMKKLIVLLTAAAVVAAFASGAYAQTTDTADVNVYVTPSDVSVALSASPINYGFGDVPLASTETVPLNGKAAILTNDGDVDVTLEKKITRDGLAGAEDTTWVFSDNYAGSLGTDWYKLWCLAKATSSEAGAPSWGDYDTTEGSTPTATASSKFTTKDNYNQLIVDSEGGSQLELGLTESTSVWFAIEMPPSVTVSDQREMLITFQATSK